MYESVRSDARFVSVKSPSMTQPVNSATVPRAPSLAASYLRRLIGVRVDSSIALANPIRPGSFDNTTETVRWSMDLRYQSAALPTNADITRLPGEDTEPLPGACYPPEKDFLIRSKLRPEQVVTTAEEFLRIRKQHQSRAFPKRWE